MLTNKLKDHKGVTLVEVLIVIGLIGVVLAPISLFFITNLNSFHRENDRINAQVEAGRIMEELTSKAMEARDYVNEGGNRHLFVTSEAGAAEMKEWIFEYSGTDKNLKMNNTNTSDVLSELSGNVTGFAITPKPDEDTARYIEIDLTVTYGSESCSLKNTVYFRNF